MGGGPKEWEYEPVLTREEGTNDGTINFVQVPPEEFREDIFSNAAEAEENNTSAKTTKDQNNKEKERPKFWFNLRITTLQISISKGSVNNFRSR